MCTGPVIRVARLDDAQELLNIYAPYVQQTAITFEYAVPTLEEFRGRMERILAKYPYLVLEEDGVILGYTYATAFVERQAYDCSAESTIYIRQDRRKEGLGRRLYEALERALHEQGITNINTRIGYPETEDEYLTRNSAQFHAHLGYQPVGEFHRCGNKFGRWYNMICMEKVIGTYTTPPSPIVPFPQLSREVLTRCGIAV